MELRRTCGPDICKGLTRGEVGVRPLHNASRGGIMPEIVCVSPIDASVVARRTTASAPEIDAALAAARKAQRDWAMVPLEERVATVLRAIEALGAMNDDIVG